MKAVVHIGTEKTGTTTIQEFLYRNRKMLEGKRVGFLQSPGPKNNRKLATYCLNDNRKDDHIIRLQIETPEKRAAWKKEFIAEFSREVEELAGKVDHVIISSEHFHSRLRSDDEVQRLHDLLSGFFTEISILVYFRRQDLVAISQNSTIIKGGGLGDIAEDIRSGKITADSDYYNYFELLEKWTRIFGKANIHPRIFEKDRLVGGDLLSDFIISTKVLDPSWNYIIPDNKNVSLSTEGLAILKAFNVAFANWTSKPQLKESLRIRLIEKLESHYEGYDLSLTEQEARNFYDLFRESNRKLAEQWFNGAPVFQEDFSRYKNPVKQESDIKATREFIFSVFADYLSYLVSSSLLISEHDLRSVSQSEKKELLQTLATIFGALPEVSNVLR